MKSSRDRVASVALAVFAGVVTLVLIYVFYASALRGRIEDKLADVRTRLAPNLLDTSGVAVVAIDDATCKAFGQTPAAGAKTADLTTAELGDIARLVLAAGARRVVLLLPRQIFPYTDADLKDLGALAKAEPRLLFGTFDLTTAGQSKTPVPKPLAAVMSQVTKADIVRDYRRESVRKLAVQHKDELPFVAAKVALLDAHRSLLAEPSAVRNHYGDLELELHYVNPRVLPEIKAEDLRFGQNVAQTAAKLKDRVVLIGYTAYRPWTFQANEATYVNSPWNSENDELTEGIPVVRLQAIAVANALTDAWLRPVPVWINVLQTLIVSVMSLLIWRFSLGFASLIFVGGWSLLLLGHAAIISFSGLHLPLTDTVLWSSMATLCGALWRLRREGHLRAEQLAVLAAERELAQVQDRFLNRFARELGTVNQGVQNALAALPPLASATSALTTAYLKARESSQELGDYLTGIQQFAALEGSELSEPQWTRVVIAEVIATVVSQFAARRQEGGFTISVKAEADAVAEADATLVSQIVYNLVSNAVKYSPPNSEIVIATIVNPKTVVISVKDQGPGIPAEFHERIFEKFYRVKDDQVYKLKGHGLGLYLSRYFAGLIDGKIAVSSPPGEGATFALTLRRFARKEHGA